MKPNKKKLNKTTNNWTELRKLVSLEGFTSPVALLCFARREVFGLWGGHSKFPTYVTEVEYLQILFCK